MKKVIATVLTVVCICACVACLASCGSGLKPYYGKTFTFTGNALAINWDKKCVFDYGPDNPSLDLSQEYTMRNLLTKYWDRIDLEHENSNFKGLGITTVDQLIAYVDAHRSNAFEDFRGASVHMGTKEEANLILTMPNQSAITMPIIENSTQYSLYADKIDTKSFYMPLNTMFTEDGGNSCYGLLDLNRDNLYESCVQVVYTAFLINDSTPTLELTLNMLTRIDEGGFVITNQTSTRDVQNNAAIYLKGSDNTLLNLPIYPEITEA